MTDQRPASARPAGYKPDFVAVCRRGPKQVRVCVHEKRVCAWKCSGLEMSGFGLGRHLPARPRTPYMPARQQPSTSLR